MNNATINGFRMVAESMSAEPRFTITKNAAGKFEIRDRGKLQGVVNSYAAAEEMVSVLS